MRPRAAAQSHLTHTSTSPSRLLSSIRDPCLTVVPDVMYWRLHVDVTVRAGRAGVVVPLSPRSYILPTQVLGAAGNVLDVTAMAAAAALRDTACV